MANFRSTINTATGRAEWVLEDETYDFFQEIARSGYADMLHDTERNILFHRALKNVISDVRKRGEPVHVLDIGTGTGLLSMMAAASGAEKVTACEAFLPMAATAKKIIASNGHGDKIRLIEKRSTDMISEDMADGKANIVVAEVFDTELIGEGALRTFIEAHERLLTENARVIPASATIYAQVVNSDIIERWARACPVSVTTSKNRFNVQPPSSFLECPGSSSVVHDLQLDQFPSDAFTPLTDPIPIFRFDFENPQGLKYNDYSQVQAIVLAESTARAVLMWWDLDMDGTGQLILSMKPNWDKNRQIQWRDHWMQAIYYLPKPISVSQGDPFWLIGNHDEHSLWFDARAKLITLHGPMPSHVCNCGLHAICSRGNMGHFNDESRYERIVAVMEKVVVGKTCLCISDCSLLPIFALKLGAKKVFALQNGQMYRRVLEEYSKANGIGTDIVFVSDLNAVPVETKIECVFGDPFFFHALLPWHNLHFWYKVVEARKLGLLKSECAILPKFAHINVIALESKDLWKIRAPVNNVEGFDLKLFDAIVLKSTELCDAEVEPHALWEYPSVALSQPKRLFSFDLESIIPEKEIDAETEILLERPGTLNQLAIWTDWEFNDGHGASSTVSTGLKDGRCDPGRQPEWNWNYRQGVYFFRYPFREVKDNEIKEIHVKATFDPESGEIKFGVKVNE